jgi:hypothetical protein
VSIRPLSYVMRPFRNRRADENRIPAAQRSVRVHQRHSYHMYTNDLIPGQKMPRFEKGRTFGPGRAVPPKRKLGVRLDHRVSQKWGLHVLGQQMAEPYGTS